MTIPESPLARATRHAEILEKKCAELEEGTTSLLQTTKDLTAGLNKITARLDALFAQWQKQQQGQKQQQAGETAKAATVSPDAVRAALEALPADQVTDILLKASLKVGHEIRPGRQPTSDDLAKAAAAPKMPPTPEEMRDAMWKRVIAQAFRTMPQEPEPPATGKP